MSLTFKGTAIPGLHHRIQTAPAALQTTRTKFAGIRGESEIVLDYGGRPLECFIWLDDPSFTSASAVLAFVNQLDGMVGTNGQLAEFGTILRFFNDCTFEGFMPTSDMLPVIGAGMTGAYFVTGTLRWWQLSV